MPTTFAQRNVTKVETHCVLEAWGCQTCGGAYTWLLHRAAHFWHTFDSNNSDMGWGAGTHLASPSEL